MRVDDASRRRGFASTTVGRRFLTLWVLPLLTGMAQAQELPPDRVNPMGHSGDVLSVVFTPDGKTLVSGGLDKMLRFWPVGGLEPIPAQDRSPRQVPQDSQQAGLEPTLRVGKEVLAIAFAPDGQSLAAAVSDAQATVPGSATIVNVATRRIVSELRGHLGGVRTRAFAPDGRTLATGGADRAIRLWDFRVGTERGAWLGPRPPGPREDRVMISPAPVVAMMFTPDGKTVATANGTPIVTFWDITNYEIRRRFRDPSGAVRALAISPDGAILATGGDGKVVTLWDLATGRQRAVLKGHLGAVACLAFAPDGRTLASGSRDASVTIWDVARAAEQVTLAHHTSAITCVAFAPDGKTLASGSLDWTVKLWNLASGAVRHSFEGSGDAIDALAFAPDGKTLASSSRDGMTRVWDLTRPGNWETLRGHSQSVGPRPLVYRPDGRSLFVGGADGKLRRWDPADGYLQAMHTRAHVGRLTALAVASDGKVLASSGDDCLVKLWDVDLKLAPLPLAGAE